MNTGEVRNSTQKFCLVFIFTPGVNSDSNAAEAAID